MPSSIAIRRLSIDCSIKVAGRKIVVSTGDSGQAGLHLLHGLFHAAGHVNGVCAAELLDDQQQPWSAVDDSITDQWSGIDQHVS
jgi:hypothetical protein